MCFNLFFLFNWTCGPQKLYSAYEKTIQLLEMYLYKSYSNNILRLTVDCLKIEVTLVAFYFVYGIEKLFQAKYD